MFPLAKGAVLFLAMVAPSLQNGSAWPCRRKCEWLVSCPFHATVIAEYTAFQPCLLDFLSLSLNCLGLALGAAMVCVTCFKHQVSRLLGWCLCCGLGLASYFHLP